LTLEKIIKLTLKNSWQTANAQHTFKLAEIKAEHEYEVKEARIALQK